MLKIQIDITSNSRTGQGGGYCNFVTIVTAAVVHISLFALSDAINLHQLTHTVRDSQTNEQTQRRTKTICISIIIDSSINYSHSFTSGIGWFQRNDWVHTTPNGHAIYSNTEHLLSVVHCLWQSIAFRAVRIHSWKFTQLHAKSAINALLRSRRNKQNGKNKTNSRAILARTHARTLSVCAKWMNATACIDDIDTRFSLQAIFSTFFLLRHKNCTGETWQLSNIFVNGADRPTEPRDGDSIFAREIWTVNIHWRINEWANKWNYTRPNARRKITICLNLKLHTHFYIFTTVRHTYTRAAETLIIPTQKHTHWPTCTSICAFECCTIIISFASLQVPRRVGLWGKINLFFRKNCL